jgi:agmatinase
MTIPETAPRQPFLTAAEPSHPGRPADVLICGIPWDEGSSFRGGPAAGPAAIRAASYVLEEYSLAAGADIRDLRLVDAGDWAGGATAPASLVSGRTVDAERQATAARIEGWLGALLPGYLASDGLLVVLGGDHLVTVPVMQAFSRLADRAGDAAADPAIGPLAALVLDAHADLRLEYEGAAWSHACVTHLLTGILGPGRVQSAGVRSATAAEAATAREAGLAWAQRGTPEATDLVAESLAALAALPAGCSLYLSVDIDVVDPAAAGGVGTPEPGGVTSLELLRAVRAIVRAAGRRLRGLDIVEVAPAHDPSGATATLGAKIIREVIAERAAAIAGQQ